MVDVVVVWTGGVGNEGVGGRELKREGVNAGLRRKSDALCCVCRGEGGRMGEGKGEARGSGREGKEVVVVAAARVRERRRWMGVVVVETDRKEAYLLFALALWPMNRAAALWPAKCFSQRPGRSCGVGAMGGELHTR